MVAYAFYYVLSKLFSDFVLCLIIHFSTIRKSMIIATTHDYI